MTGHWHKKINQSINLDLHPSQKLTKNGSQIHFRSILNMKCKITTFLEDNEEKNKLALSTPDSMDTQSFLNGMPAVHGKGIIFSVIGSGSAG